MIKPGAVTVDALASNTITLAKLSRQTDGTILQGKGAGANVAANVMSGDATISGTGALTLGTIVSGGKIANTTVGAGVAPGGNRALTAAEVGAPVRLVLDINDAASGNADFTALPYKILVVDVKYIHGSAAGDAGNSVALHNGTGGAAITDAMNNASANGVKSAGTLANTTVAANATLRVVTVRGGAAGTNAVRLVVEALRIA
jgi:hypothetical protein